jgi:glycosyltransferase involved in cell wall biosynthesis
MSIGDYPDIAHLVIGPADHGVVRFGERLGELMGGPVLRLSRPELLTPATADLLLDRHPRSIHLQYTDALYADHTTAAATAFEQVCRQLSVPVTVTMHDLPDPGDEPGRYARRAHSYARVAAAVSAIALNSDHESGLLTILLAAAPEQPPVLRTVVPLPVETPVIRPESQRPTPRPEVAVFGFIYPGKGHEDVLQDLAELPAEIAFTALGRPADGHDDLVATLAALAARSQRRMDVTGFIADAELNQRLQRVAVPVAPGRLVSASGSINTWIDAGRRPLVAAGGYTREFDRRYPGAVRLYRPGQLPELIRAVLADPGLSWLSAPVPVFPTGADRARAYGEALRYVHEPVG